MKVEIVIRSASDGGVMVVIDPSAETLQRQVDAGTGTPAHTYALEAYRAMHELAKKAAAAGAYVEAGELPPNTH